MVFSSLLYIFITVCLVNGETFEVPSGSTVSFDNEGFVISVLTSDGMLMSRGELKKVKDRHSQTNSQGWVASARYTNDSVQYFQNMTCSFGVPSGSPSCTDSTVFYLFPGIQGNYEGVEYIIQPVLEWDYNVEQWVVKCWYVTSGGDSVHSSPIPAKDSEVLEGDMIRKSDDSYYMVSYAKNDPTRKTEITVTRKSLATNNFASVTVEAYGSGIEEENCDCYPSGKAPFQNIALYDANGNNVKPLWEKVLYTKCVTDIDIIDPTDVVFDFANK